jgi:hypothetical protein
MLNFSRHARNQMKRRGISRAEVRYCLNNPDITITPKEGCKQFRANHPSGKRIKVVVDTEKNKVVTVILLD